MEKLALGDSLFTDAAALVKSDWVLIMIGLSS